MRSTEQRPPQKRDFSIPYTISPYSSRSETKTFLTFSFTCEEGFSRAVLCYRLSSHDCKINDKQPAPK